MGPDMKENGKMAKSMAKVRIAIFNDSHVALMMY